MTFRTEDQVRNQAGITLGFIDAKGNIGVQGVQTR